MKNSFVYLRYKDIKFEKRYQDILEESANKSYFFFSAFLLFLGILLLIFFGSIKFFIDMGKSRNLNYNFWFVLINIVVGFLILHIISNKNLKEKKFWKILIMVLIEFCITNYFSSLTSVLIVYFRIKIELASLLFFIENVLRIIFYIYLVKCFHLVLFINCTQIAFTSTLLLKLHFTSIIITYLLTHILLRVFLLAFTYFYEYVNRKFFYILLKVEKEKEYFLNTLNSFNVSYFEAKNYEITKFTNSNLITNPQPAGIIFNNIDTNIKLKTIEQLFTNLISIENVPMDLENFLLEHKENASFKFRRLIYLIKNNKDLETYFKKFSNVGIFKIAKNEKENNYMQLYMKIKIKKNKIKKNLFTLNSQETENSYPDEDEDCSRIIIEGVFADITQNYLKKENQYNAMLLAKYIHDIKSPLFLLLELVKSSKISGAILPNVSMPARTINQESTDIQLDKFSKAETVEYSKCLKHIAKYILEIIVNITNFTKVQNNLDIGKKSKEVNKEMKDFRKIVNFCVDFYKMSTKFSSKNNLKVSSVIDDKIPQEVLTNDVLLKQILINLLSNAIKFTHSGEVKVICKLKSKFENMKECAYLQVNVIDTGVGISEENIDKLCKPFKWSTSSKNTGSGLGLSIVNDLLGSLGSKLEIQSVPNKGSIFSFDLQLIEDKNNSFIFSTTNDVIYETTSTRESPASNQNVNKSPIASKLDSNHSYLKTDETLICNLPLTTKGISENEFYQLIRRDKPTDHSIGYSSSYSPKKVNSITRQNINHLKLSEIANLNKKKNSSNGLIRPAKKRTNSPQNAGSSFQNDVNSIAKTSTEILNLIIFDDDITFVKQISNLIKKSAEELSIQVKIEYASDPIEGLYKMYSALKQRNEYYDILFTDENMPFLRGSDFVSIYNSYFINNGFYKLNLVSFSDDILRQYEAKNKHFDFMLSKPATRMDVKKILSHFLNKKAI